MTDGRTERNARSGCVHRRDVVWPPGPIGLWVAWGLRGVGRGKYAEGRADGILRMIGRNDDEAFI